MHCILYFDFLCNIESKTFIFCFSIFSLVKVNLLKISPHHDPHIEHNWHSEGFEWRCGSNLRLMWLESNPTQIAGQFYHPSRQYSAKIADFWYSLKNYGNLSWKILSCNDYNIPSFSLQLRSLTLIFYKLCGIIFKNKQSWMIQFSLFSFPEVRNSQGYKCALCYKRVWQVGHKSRKQGEGSCGSWGSTLGLVIIVKQTCASTHPLLFRHTQHNTK